MTPPHRTPEMKAISAAGRHARTQDDLDTLLAQIAAPYRQTILERLKPHLSFEPKPFTPKPHKALGK